MEFDFALAQDIGTRSEQQDSAAVCPFERAHGALFVIADGLGGHTGGARASHIVVKSFADAGESGRFNTPRDRYEQLGLALQSSNEEIAHAARELAHNETMGTTLVAAAAAWNSVGWISVGDSHLYLWRGGTITKLNEDHSQAGQMLKSGRYKADDPELDAYRSMLRSAIMGRELTLIDRPIETTPLQRNDVIILATDGLNVIDLPEVEKIVSNHAVGPSESLANALLDAVRASEYTSRDNATVIVARVVSLDGEAVGADAVTTRLSTSQVVDEETLNTTAIVTTPFFKVGRQPLDVTRRLQSEPIQPATVRHPAAPSQIDAAPPQKSLKPIATDSVVGKPAPRRSRWALWTALVIILASGAAGAAWFVYPWSAAP